MLLNLPFFSFLYVVFFFFVYKTLEINRVLKGKNKDIVSRDKEVVVPRSSKKRFIYAFRSKIVFRNKKVNIVARKRSALSNKGLKKGVSKALKKVRYSLKRFEVLQLKGLKRKQKLTVLSLT